MGNFAVLALLVRGLILGDLDPTATPPVWMLLSPLVLWPLGLGPLVQLVVADLRGTLPREPQELRRQIDRMEWSTLGASGGLMGMGIAALVVAPSLVWLFSGSALVLVVLTWIEGDHLRARALQLTAPPPRSVFQPPPESD